MRLQEPHFSPLVRSCFPPCHAPRYTKNKVNPSFNDDKTQLTYTRQTYWNFVPELSFADPADISITTLNPPYLGALHHAKSELLLPVGYSAVVVRELFDFLKGQYWSDTKKWDGASAASNVSNTLIDSYAADNNIPRDAAKAWFFNYFANASAPLAGFPTAEYFSLALALGSNPATTTPISASTAAKLWDSTNALSFTYPPESFFDNAYTRWLTIHTNATRLVEYKTAFEMTDSQIDAVSTWLASPSAMNGFILKYEQLAYEFVTKEQMLVRAYCQGAFGNGKGVSDLYPSLYAAGPVEYYHWQVWKGTSVPSLSDLQCTQMYLAPKNFTDALFLGDHLPLFAAAIASGDYSEVKTKFGVDTYVVAAAITNYYVPVLLLNPGPISTTYGKPAVEYWKKHGSGLFATRRAYEWLWNYTDPLAIRMMPDAPPMSFRHNLSTPEFAIAHTRPWTINSGVKDIDLLQDTLVWDGLSSVPFYGDLYPVHGATEDGQYAPFLDCHLNISHINTWVDDYAKDVRMNCIDDNSIVGSLHTYAFTPDNTTWLVDPSLENYVPGFSNLSAKYNDSPVFLSNPHFFGVPPYFRGRISGLPESEVIRDQTLVHVEPYTGKVAKFRKGLQANLYIPANVTWFYSSDYANMYTDVMFPVMVGFVYTEMTPALMKKITSSVYLALDAKPIVFWILLSLSIALLAGCLIAALVFIRRYKQSNTGWTQIQ